MQNKNKFYIAGVLFLVGILLLILRPGGNECPPEYKNFKVAKADFTLECAISRDDRARGLSGRDSLPLNTGLLFVFENPGILKFWMKDMEFPIDMIWLDENKKIVFIEKNVSPDTYPEYFAPTDYSKYVLEVNAGQSDRYDIKVGDIAVF